MLLPPKVLINISIYAETSACIVQVHVALDEEPTGSTEAALSSWRVQATHSPELCSLLCTGNEASEEGLSAFTKLTQASVEALRYRGEDVEKSLTKNTVKEVRPHALHVACTVLIEPVSVLKTHTWSAHGEAAWAFL